MNNIIKTHWGQTSASIGEDPANQVENLAPTKSITMRDEKRFTSENEIRHQLLELIKKASDSDCLIQSKYQGIFFFPHKLKALNDEGKFLWGIDNWQLVPYVEYLDTIQKGIQAEQQVIDRLNVQLKEATMWFENRNNNR